MTKSHYTVKLNENNSREIRKEPVGDEPAKIEYGPNYKESMDLAIEACGYNGGGVVEGYKNGKLVESYEVGTF